MRNTQIATFELGPACNLGTEHKACPNLHPDRCAGCQKDKRLTDAQIIDTATALYHEHGFRGAIAWHYYNEPLIYAERMYALMTTLRDRCPEARFLLWSNGELLPPEGPELDKLKAFDYAWLTNYHNQDFSRAKTVIKRVNIVRWQLDSRLQDLGPVRRDPCGRMWTEIVFCHHGDCHICCVDWRNHARLGNLTDTPLPTILDRWTALRASISGREMTDAAPDCCLRCIDRHAHVAHIIPGIAEDGAAACRRGTLPRAPTTTATTGIAAARRGTLQRAPTTPANDTTTLALACLGEPTPDWTDHHAALGAVVTVVRSDDEARTALRAAAQRGETWGLVLRPYHRLRGPVAQALALHPRENHLQVPLTTDPNTTLPIVSLRDIGAVVGGRCRLSVRVPCRRIRLEELRIDSTEPPKRPRLAVVFVHYRLPLQRLVDHLEWNADLYRAADAKVFVVCDPATAAMASKSGSEVGVGIGVEHPAAPPAPSLKPIFLPYPGPMPIFSLAKTKNYGIRAAIESGYTQIIATDADIAWTPSAWEACIATPQGVAAVPIYHMAASYADRATDYVPAPMATGTVAMTADMWRAAHFHEACIGYGSDDGILLQAIRRNKWKRQRTPPLYHIAHLAHTPQKEFCQKNPRIDHWGRDSGFNPENFKDNRKLYHTPIDHNPHWGLADRPAIAFVLTHYRLPERRLREFLEWNSPGLERLGARLIIVSDRDYQDLPPWARVAIYPGELPLFNLSKTSNYGIRLAGAGIICKTDPDVLFSPQALDAVAAVTPQRGTCFVYRMALSTKPEDLDDAKPWEASKGTIALHSDHWAALCGYDERQEGYGIEDGDCYHRAGNCGTRTAGRSPAPIWHIAHTDAPQTSGNTRKDCWNRSEGFNPRNHARNQRARHSAAWADPHWGSGT
jgi:hypothetical protein